MKAIGRIIMLAVGAWLLFLGIHGVVGFVQGFEWEGVKELLEQLPTYKAVIRFVVYILFGLSAVFSFIRGKGSFRYIVYSVIILGFSIYSFISQGGFSVNALAAVEFIGPALYLVGSIFMIVGSAK